MAPGYFPPRMIAGCIVQAVENGDVQTIGQWWALRERYRELPPRLRVWVYDELIEILGPERTAYVLGPRESESSLVLAGGERDGT